MYITNISLKKNSIQYPQQEYAGFDFINNNDWCRLYMQYTELAGKTYDTDGGGYSLTYDEFGQLYPIFCFDLTKQDPQIWASSTDATIEVRFQRSSTALPAPFNGYSFRFTAAIIETERYIELEGVSNRLRLIY